MKRGAAKAKNDKKFFEKLARKNNPIRSTMALPADVNLDEVDWKPDFAERGFSRLAELDARFAEKQLEYLRSKCAALQSVVDADRAWLAAQAEREAELKG